MSLCCRTWDHRSRGFATTSQVTEIARTGDAQRGELDLYGQRYTIDVEMETAVGKATIRSGWIVLHGKSAPRLTTCYVMKRKR